MKSKRFSLRFLTSTEQNSLILWYVVHNNKAWIPKLFSLCCCTSCRCISV